MTLYISSLTNQGNILPSFHNNLPLKLVCNSFTIITTIKNTKLNKGNNLFLKAILYPPSEDGWSLFHFSGGKFIVNIFKFKC